MFKETASTFHGWCAVFMRQAVIKLRNELRKEELLVLFRKRLPIDIIMEANEYILQAERKRKAETKNKDDLNQTHYPYS